MTPVPRRSPARWLAAQLCALVACLGAQAAQAQDTPDAWTRLGMAARKAALAPRTWVPLAGAAALRVGDADGRLQSWAATHTPLFGSQANADRSSDSLKDALNGAWITSALVPWEDEAGEGWLRSKSRVLLVEASANMVNSATVGALKDGTARMRPNGRGATSFPSDHAARAALHSGMTRHNMSRLGWSAQAQEGGSATLDVLSGLTAWARVEANQHYPSDVLAGMALGNFIAVLFTDAYLSPTRSGQPLLSLQLARGRTELQLQWRH